MRAGTLSLIQRSVVAAQHVLAMAVSPAVVRRVMPAITVGIQAGYRALPIDRIRRVVARTGIGRALIDIVILLQVLGRRIAVLLHRIGKPLTPAAAAVTARINRGWNVALRAGAVPATRHRGRSGHGHHGEGRYQSRNRRTHYSLLWIGFLLAWISANACRVLDAENPAAV